MNEKQADPTGLSRENNAMLRGLIADFKTFVSEQQGENEKIHKRIDVVAETVNQRSRISSGFIFGFVAILLSMLTLIGGVVQAYVSGRIDGLRPEISTHTQSINESRRDAETLALNVTDHRVKTAMELAALAERTRWLEKVNDSRK